MLELWVRYRKYSRLLLVLLASFALLTFQHTRPEGQWLAEGVAAVTAPIQAGFARIHRAALGGWTTYLEWRALRTDVTRLRAEVAALRLRQLRQDELDAENARLRLLLSLRERLSVRTIGAEVVAREWDGFTRRLTINRGRTDGLERLAPVIVTRGVVNRTRAQGPVEGVAGGRMRLKLAAREEGVAVGDAVFTSGIGGLFPRGLPLGRVTRIQPATAIFRLVELEPAVDLSTVEEVLILPRGMSEDLSSAFLGEGRPDRSDR